MDAHETDLQVINKLTVVFWQLMCMDFSPNITPTVAIAAKSHDFIPLRTTIHFSDARYISLPIYIGR